MRLLVAGILAWPAAACRAADPEVHGLRPRGGQRGTEVPLVLTGPRLAGAQEILWHRPGIAARGVTNSGDKGADVSAVLAIAPDCPIGEHPFRLRTASGLTPLRTFFVGPFPTVAEVEPNSDFASPQKVPLNVTVEGVVRSEDVDFYAVEARKGDRLTAEIEGIRLGSALFDPYVAILDARRFELDAADDTALLMQDAVASAVAPADGVYIIEVRESSYGGGDASAYRLHAGTFPRPRAVIPAGGRPGETLDVRFLGDVAGPTSARITLPQAGGLQGVVAEGGGLAAPSPNWVRVADMPNVIEAETNDVQARATAAGAPPAALNGVIERAGDVDWFTFQAVKGQALRMEVHARRLRSALDPVLAVHAADGRRIAENDDSGGPDSRLDFTAPADGVYAVCVRDHLGQGGPAFAYRLEIAPPAPSIGAAVPVFKKDTQDYQSAPVPRGNRFAAWLAVRRDGVGGEARLALEDLPPGVTATVAPVPEGIGQVPVLLEAAEEAPLAGRLARVTVAGRAGEREVVGGLVHDVELVRGNPNNVTYYRTQVDRYAVAVTEASPFRIEVVPPRAPLLQGGVRSLAVNVVRREGFTAPVTVKLLFSPPGVSAPPEVRIPEGQSSAILPLNASGDAAARVWKTVVIGSAAVGGGELWVSSPFVDLEVAPPFLRGEVAMTAVEQGRPAEVVCRIEPLRPFEGAGRLRLLGLPAKCTVEDVAVTKDSREAVFKVATAPDSPAGQHRTLFCSLDLDILGDAVSQTVTPMGTLRIDPPPPPKKDAPAVAVAPAPAPPAAPVERRLSRLEQLRLQQSTGGPK